MRKAAWGLLLVFVFTIPWEYSLDLGDPLGNVARIAGLVLLLVAIPAVLQAGRLRTPCAAVSPSRAERQRHIVYWGLRRHHSAT